MHFCLYKKSLECCWTFLKAFGLSCPAKFNKEISGYFSSSDLCKILLKKLSALGFLALNMFRGYLCVCGRQVMSSSLPPRGLQHARLPVLSYLPVFAQIMSITVSSSVTHFSRPQSSPASRVFSSELAVHIRWPKY